MRISEFTSIPMAPYLVNISHQMKEGGGLKGVKQQEGGARQGGKRAPVIKEMKESRDGVKEEEEVVYR